MNKLLNAFINMNDLDDFAMGDTVIHCFHPLLKLILTLLMIIFILSTYRLVELIVDMMMIFIVAYIAHIPFFKLIKRGLIGLPLSLCLGLSFLIFNRQYIYYYGFIVLEGVVLCTLVFMKTFLCLILAYIFISTTSFDSLMSELSYLKIPSFFLLQMMMTYRYIFVLFNEAQMMSKAYLLRNTHSKGIELKDMGSFIGHLLVNSMNKSQHIYDCMKCRGFDIQKTYKNHTIIEIDNIFLFMIILGIIIIIKAVSI